MTATRSGRSVNPPFPGRAAGASGCRRRAGLGLDSAFVDECTHSQSDRRGREEHPDREPIGGELAVRGPREAVDGNAGRQVVLEVARVSRDGADLLVERVVDERRALSTVIPTRSGLAVKPRVPLCVLDPISAVESLMLPKPFVDTAEVAPSGAVPSEPPTVRYVNTTAWESGKTASAQFSSRPGARVAVTAAIASPSSSSS